MTPTTSTGNGGELPARGRCRFRISRLTVHCEVHGRCVVCRNVGAMNVTDLDLNGLVCCHCVDPVLESEFQLVAVARLDAPNPALIGIDP